MTYCKFSIIVLAICLVSILSCNKKGHSKEEVERAMKYYDHLLQEMSTDSIALLYTKDGDLGEMAHGRDSIRKFLASFRGFKVLSQSSVTDSMSLNDDTAFQKGIYHQTTVTPHNDTLRIKGEYKINWIWQHDNGWHIKRIDTRPL